MKVQFQMGGCVSQETQTRNVQHAKGIGLPYTSFSRRGRLAVIGGGQSIKNHLQELREFDGERWIVASAFGYCRDNGIEGTLFNIDPQPLSKSPIDLRGVKSAILATTTDASWFQELVAADVRIFDLITTNERANHGPTTVSAAPELSVSMGYSHAVFYGCEGSNDGQTHAYKDVSDPYGMIVTANGQKFHTFPEWLAQCDVLATLIRLIPDRLSERSGGLLGAMVASGDYDVTHVAQALHDILEFKEAA